jgi:hypothetical protein
VFIKKTQRKGMVTVVIVSYAVEFGDKVKAKSLLAGEIVVILNQNILMITVGNVSKGQFKDVLFYKEDVEKQSEQYHPGE